MIVQDDIRDVAFIAQLFTKNQFDAIVHLADKAGMRAPIQDHAF